VSVAWLKRVRKTLDGSLRNQKMGLSKSYVAEPHTL